MDNSVGVLPDIDRRKSPVTKIKNPSSHKPLIIILLLIVLILASAFGTTFYLLQKEKNKVENPVEVANADAEKVKTDVGKLIILNEEENPTIATIIDADKLREENPTFYKDATNGDKLLIYSDRAILYNPDRNIIVNVAPIIKQPDSESATNVDSDTLTIELRDASGGKTGVISGVQNKIAELGQDYSVQSTSTTSSSETSSVIYDLSGGTKTDLVNALVEKLGYEVRTELPQNEVSSTADVVIIAAGN